MTKLKFGEFAPISRDIFRQNPIVYGTSTRSSTYTARLYTDDALLARRGTGDARELDLYLDLLTDECVLAVVQRQIHEVLSREWDMIPPQEPEKEEQELAVWIKTKLLELGNHMPDVHRGKAILNKQPGGFDGVVSALLEAIVVGYRAAEIVWELDKEEEIPVPLAIIPKDSRRFLFEYDAAGRIYPKHRAPNKSYDGEFLPPRKFIFHTFHTYSNDNPNGMGYGRELFFPVTWKREAITSWSALIDRHVQPIKIGKVTADATDEDMDLFLQSMRNLAQHVSTVLPEGYEYEVITPSLDGAQVLSEFIKYMDRQISKVILGEASTGEAIPGSLSRDEVSNSIRVRKAKGYADQLAFTLNNTLIKWMAEFKNPNVRAPRIVWDFEDMKTTENKTIIETISTLMRDVEDYNPDLDWLEQKTGIPRVRDEDGATGGAKPGRPDINSLLAEQEALLADPGAATETPEPGAEGVEVPQPPAEPPAEQEQVEI